MDLALIPSGQKQRSHKSDDRKHQQHQKQHERAIACCRQAKESRLFGTGGLHEDLLTIILGGDSPADGLACVGKLVAYRRRNT